LPRLSSRLDGNDCGLHEREEASPEATPSTPATLATTSSVASVDLSPSYFIGTYGSSTGVASLWCKSNPERCGSSQNITKPTAPNLIPKPSISEIDRIRMAAEQAADIHTACIGFPSPAAALSPPVTLMRPKSGGGTQLAIWMVRTAAVSASHPSGAGLPAPSVGL
jgi:hypothetical protein